VAEAAPTPKFRHPPVIETVLAVQFAPIQRFTAPYFGVFWNRIRAEYPRQETQRPLGQQMEHFGGPPGMPTVRITTVPPEPDARCWFINDSGTQLIQVQRDRFIRNWRRTSVEQAYPSYDVLKPRFAEDWDGFCEFLASEKLGQPDANQCEVTYVNHIPQGEGWTTVGETQHVLSLLASPSREFLPEPEILTLNSRYVMPDKKGRLHVTLQPAVQRPDGLLVLQLTLTARGRPSSARREDILSWLDMGHEWVVRGFADITTAEMHTRWGRLYGSSPR